MGEQADNPAQSNPQAPFPTPNPSAPYESVLIKSFDKLTSQVFIFLLAYLIIVVGLAVFAPQLTSQVPALLYILPVLGIGAYLMQQQRSIASQAKRHGIDVKAGITIGDAQVSGVRSMSGSDSLPTKVSVSAHLVSGRSRVEGVVIGDEEKDHLDSDSRYLLETFQQLSPQKRRKVIASVQKLLDER